MQTADSQVQAAFTAHQAGNFGEASRLYRAALALDSRHFNALQLLGVLAIQEADWGSADQWLVQALEIAPDSEPALLNHALVLQELKRPDAALDCYDRLLLRHPANAPALNGRGLVLAFLGRDREAFNSLEAASRSDPCFAEAAFNFGTMLDRQGERERARTEYERALNTDPNYVDALYQLGVLLLNQGQNHEGNALLQRVLAIEPAHRQAGNHAALVAWQSCDWTDFELRRAAILADVEAGMAATTTFYFLSVSDDPGLQRLLANSEYRDLGLDRIRALPFTEPVPPAGEKLRIAYISGDFREHAVSYLTAGLFELHDRTRFEVIGASFGPNTQDAMYRRVSAAFDRFIDIRGFSDSDAAAHLRSLKIDIAIDLAGATQNARSAIFAHRVAPLQISFLGFPGGGYPTHDYIIADHYVIPEGLEQHYNEACIRMPDVFQANDHKRQISPQPVSRRQYGLPEDGFVFCVFLATGKINPDMFSIWMRLLAAVKDSVLWLAVGNQSAQDNLKREASQRGISETRLRFTGVIPYQQHLARCTLADLALDTFPFNGGTTTSDLLFAGVPIVTMAGRAFASRMTGSLVTALGLASLIATDLEGYEALALKLATHPKLLGEVRTTLAQARAAALFDTARFTQQLELAFVKIIDRQRNDLPPESFSVGQSMTRAETKPALEAVEGSIPLTRVSSFWERLFGKFRGRKID